MLNLFLAFSGIPQLSVLQSHLSPILFSFFIYNVHRSLYHCCFLYFFCFANDIKLYLRICTLDNSTQLQTDLHYFSDWFNTLSLTLNFTKCKIMTSTRTCYPLRFPYFFNGNFVSDTVECIMNPDFKLSYNLDPSSHIEHMCCKSFKTRGFIMRLIKDY